MLAIGRDRTNTNVLDGLAKYLISGEHLREKFSSELAKLADETRAALVGTFVTKDQMDTTFLPELTSRRDFDALKNHLIAGHNKSQNKLEDFAGLERKFTD